MITALHAECFKYLRSFCCLYHTTSGKEMISKMVSHDIPSQQGGLQGLFQEDVEEDEHQVMLNTMADTPVSHPWRLAYVQND